MSDVLVETASMAHVPVLAALHRACFDEPWSESAMADLLAMPGAFALMATQAGEPLGLVLCRVAADECEVVTLGVVPEARRQGTARKLMTAALDTAGARCVTRMFLEVACDSAAAKGLYGALGFKEVGRRPNYYRGSDKKTDALILARTL